MEDKSLSYKEWLNEVRRWVEEKFEHCFPNHPSYWAMGQYVAGRTPEETARRMCSLSA